MYLCLAGIALMATVCLAHQHPAEESQARLTRNGMPVIRGEARFLIGLYEDPSDDARLRDAVAGGFNLIHCPPKREALDQVRDAGAWAWVTLGDTLDLSTDAGARKRSIAEAVRELGSHPALLIWEGPDEPCWNVWGNAIQQSELEIAAMRSEAQGNPSIRRLFDEAVDRYQRALWPEWQALRLQFWAQAGKRDPHPEARIDLAAAAASRLARGLSAGIRYLRSLDAKHYVWLNHAPRNSLRALRQFNRAVDMAGCDIYPIPYNLRTGHSDLVNMRPSSVGDYTDRMRKAAPGKACAMVLQGFGWADLEDQPDEIAAKLGVGRRPTQQEQRFMAWDAIIHGANALLYWGTAYLKDPKSAETQQFWRELLSVTHEIRSLEHFLVSPNVEPAPVVQVEEHYASNDGTGVRVAIKHVGGRFLVCVVNENPYAVAFTIRGLPEALEGSQLKLLGANSSGALQVRGRAFRDGVRGFDVRIYLGDATRAKTR